MEFTEPIAEPTGGACLIVKKEDERMKAKIVYRALALVVVFSLAAVVVPASPAVAEAPAVQDGGSRLVGLQQSDGGWDWPLDENQQRKYLWNREISASASIMGSLHPKR